MVQEMSPSETHCIFFVSKYLRNKLTMNINTMEDCLSTHIHTHVWKKKFIDRLDVKSRYFLNTRKDDEECQHTNWYIP